MTGRRGFSLVELLVTIVIISLVTVAVFTTLAQGVQRAITGMRRTQAVHIMEGLMEQVKSRRFDENTQPPWSSTLGPDGGESDPSTFDDVDDFKGWVEDPVPDYKAAYRTEIDVFYVNKDTLDNEVTGPTDYKHIAVKIENNLLGESELHSLVARPFRQPPPPPENCNNSTDDDGDGEIDCADPDCKDAPPCIPFCDPDSGPEGATRCAGGTVPDPQRRLEKCVKDPQTGQFEVQETCDPAGNSVCFSLQTGSGSALPIPPCLPYNQTQRVSLGQRNRAGEYCHYNNYNEGNKILVILKDVDWPNAIYDITAIRCQGTCQQFRDSGAFRARCSEDAAGDQCPVTCRPPGAVIPDCSGGTRCASSTSVQWCQYNGNTRHWEWQPPVGCQSGYLCCVIQGTAQCFLTATGCP